MINRCNLQRGIPQPILRCFFTYLHVDSKVLSSMVPSFITKGTVTVQGDPLGCLTGNGEKVSSSHSQAEPGQEINSAVV